jgi:radical SAM protein with 4Fe4S-binding SPASM domain
MFNLRYQVAKLVDDYYLGEIVEQFDKQGRVPAPRYVVWDCSRKCNLRCVHCGAVKERYASELTAEQIRRAIGELAGLGVNMLAATGGEPLLREDLLDVLEYASRRGLRTGISTNGFLIDEAMADRIRACSLHSVQVSLDGLENTHNQIRNHPESFRRAVHALRLLRERRIPIVSVATTVMPQNLAELGALRELLLQLGIKRWRLAIVLPIGRADGTSLALNSEQLLTLLRFVQASRKRIGLYLGENLTFLGEWERELRDAPLYCPAGLRACCIGVDGHVRGCPEQPDEPSTREGSVLERPFAEIWQKGFRRYRNREILAQDPACAACRSKYDCWGGCWVMRSQDRHCIYRLLGNGPR